MVADAGGVLEEDYEAQRAANIAANVELMKSLGLYQTTTSLVESARAVVKAKSTAVSADDYTPAATSVKVERPKRVTRSASRTLETPIRVSARRKRAASDEASSSYRTSTYTGTRHDSADATDINDSETDTETDRRRRGKRPRTPYNRNRSYRDAAELQRQTDRLGVRLYDPKTFGSIPNIPIGTRWLKRMDCSTASIHAPTVAGISGNPELGCWSICLSGGYEDDVDNGTTFTYTGSGGRDLKGTHQNPKNLRTAPQSKHQQWDGKNAALRKSVQTGKPVRVVRGYKGNNAYSPREGYVYSGLYRVTRAWMEIGAAGWKVCKFSFERLDGQAELPIFDHSVPSDNDDDDDRDDRDDRDDGDDEDGEDAEEDVEVVEVSARAMRALDRTKPCASNRCPPSSSSSPAAADAAAVQFDRTAYIVISDTEDDDDDEEGQVLLQLDLPPAEVREMAAPSPSRSEPNEVRRRSHRRSLRRA